MRKLATVLQELQARIHQRNCIAEVIEKLQSNQISIQISFGNEDPIQDTFMIEVPEMTFMPWTTEQRKVYEFAKVLYLKRYKQNLRELRIEIKRLHEEKTSILQTLEKPIAGI
jgi:hypothetical protein